MSNKKATDSFLPKQTGVVFTLQPIPIKEAQVKQASIESNTPILFLKKKFVPANNVQTLKQQFQAAALPIKD